MTPAVGTTTFRPGGPGGAPSGHYRFRGIARMEWIKLRSLRSVRWTALATAVITIGLGMLVLHLAVARWGHISRADQRIFDPVSNGFTGLALAQLAAAAIGVLAVTSEYSSGMIRATLAAAPGRARLALAKAAVLAAAVLLIGEVLAFVTFFASEAMLHAPVPRATLATPGALRAVTAAGAYLALIALIGVGAGLIIRHSAAAITTLCVVILLLPALTLPFSASVQHATQKFLPEIIAENSLTAVKPIPYSLTPWMGLAVLMLYAAVVVGAGTWLLARRDA
jgi:ABC-type transport system involved in multi-copper enzyme maturation permease subunit